MLSAFELHHWATVGLVMLTVTLGIWANQRLYREPPRLRLAIGCAGMLASLAPLALFPPLLWSPVFDPGGTSPAIHVALIAVCAIMAGTFWVATTQFVGGTIQAFQRWRYYQRNPRHASTGIGRSPAARRVAANAGRHRPDTVKASGRHREAEPLRRRQRSGRY
jgi:hypothetical protein